MDILWKVIKFFTITFIISIGFSTMYKSFSNNGHIAIHDVERAVEPKALDKLTAEDLSMTTSMLLKQLSVQMQRWSKEDVHSHEWKDQFEKELEEHPHFHGVALMKNNEIQVEAGDITRLDLSKLSHRHLNSQFSDPYPIGDEQFMLIGEKLKDGRSIIGEINLSFIQTFVKDIASVADTSGTFFVTGSDQEVDWKTTDDIPENIYSHTVPELGWQIVVHSDDDEDEKRNYVEHQAVIKFKNDKKADEWFATNEEIKMIDHFSPFFIVESKNEKMPELVRRLGKDRALAFVEPNYVISNQVITSQRKTRALKEATPNDEFFEPYQWNLKQINVNAGWNLASGQDVTIAIIDTGVDPDHPDLKNKLLDGYNVVEQSDDYSDNHGHGTHVAGIAAALTNNVTGIAGVSWKSNILPVKVLDEEGEGSTYEVAKGIYWAVDQGADVINMSLGNYQNSNVLYDAIKYAYDRDVILISASGNDNVETPMFPSQYKEVLAVAAVDEARNRAFFSNYGNHVNISAPGEHIPSSFPGNHYVVMSGTSMAAPHVSGLAALIRSLRPDLSNKQVYEVIVKTARDLGVKGHDPYYGAGEIDVVKALQFIN